MRIRRLNFIIVALIATLAIAVLLGWIFNIKALVQVLPGQAPMQFNTAIGFLLASIASYHLLCEKKLWVSIAGSLLLILATLTLSQYLFSYNLGLDNLFWEPSITDKTSHPGRMAPNTALCFTFSSLVLLIGGYARPGRSKAIIICIITATLVAQAVNTLTGYVFRLEAAYGWMQWTRMAIHTGFGFFLLSIVFSIYILVFDHRSVKTLHRLYISIIIAYTGLLMTITLCLAQRSGESKSISELIESRMESYKLDVRRSMTDRLRAFERLSGRWDNFLDETALAENAAYQFIRDFPGLDAIAWVDNSREEIEVYSLEFNQNYQNIPKEKEILKRVDNLNDNHNYVGLRDTVGWPQAIFSFKVETPTKGHIGTLLFYWRAADVFRTEASDFIQAYEVKAICEGQLIYDIIISDSGFNNNENWIRDTEINIDGMQINLRFQPTKETIDQLHTKTTNLLFGAGSLLSLLLAFSAYSFMDSLKKAREAIATKAEITRLAFRLQVATAGAEIGIWELDLKTKQVSWNDIAARHLSLDQNKNSGGIEEWLEHLDENDRESFLKQLQDIQKENDSFPIVCKCFFDTNILRHLQFVATSVSSSNQEVIGIVYDITEDVEQHERDQALTKELQRSNKELEDFARIASHDLQEPLRKIRAFGERLSTHYGSQLDKRGNDYVVRMRGAADRMSRLIQDLLAFSRVSTRTHTFDSVSLNKVLTFAKENLEASIEESSATIEATELPIIQGDQSQLVQLFQNLIGNSIKYASPNEAPIIKISSKDSRDEIGRPIHEICFKDNGIGFEQDYADKIFEVFQRLHGVAEYAGTGVGLSICKKIVERHKGKIRAESELGGGASFYLEIPRF